jgi:hypothetical protein
MSLDMIGALATPFVAQSTAIPQIATAFAKPQPVAPAAGVVAPAPQSFTPWAPSQAAALRVPPPAVLASRFLAPKKAARAAAAQDVSMLSWLPWVLVGTGVVVAGAGWYVMTKDAV